MSDDAKRPVVEALARRPDLWVFRGSLVTAAHISPWPRKTDDVDLIALPGLCFEDGLAALGEALGGLPDRPSELAHTVLWPESPNPGLRVEVNGVQVDLAFGDPMVPGPVQLEVLGVPVLAARVEAMIAWKLHGLFELESLAWRPKDLSDLHDLLVRPPLLDGRALDEAIRVAFAFRDTPLRITDRLMRGELGTSASSRKRWRRYREAHPERMAGDDLADVVRTVASYLAAHVGPLRAAEPDPTPFAVSPTLAEIDVLVAATPRFARYDHGDLRVFHYEGHPVFEDPNRAVTNGERRRRQLLRECRGITFHADGRLLSRKLHRFGGFRAPLPAGAPHAVEKLDGTLVSPLPLGERVRLVTRRGPSELGDRADALLSDRARAVLTELLAAGRTALLEWTSATHRIVEAHPDDRLWLLAVRDHVSGAYASPSEVQVIAARAGLPTPRHLGPVADPVAFAAEVAAQPTGEGWVLCWDDGTWMKVKSDRYLRLHRCVEGSDRASGALAAALHGQGDEARALWEARGQTAPLDLDAVEAAIAKLVADVEADVARFAGHDRGDFARALAELPAPARRLRFRVWDGAAADPTVRALLREVDTGRAAALLGLLTEGSAPVRG